MTDFRPPPGGFRLPTEEELAALPHDDLGPTVLASIWTFAGLALAFVSVRIYCKLKRHGTIWWDDGILIASWAALASSNGFITAAVRLGYGKHIWDIPPETFLFRLPILMSCQGTLAILAAAWSKTSFAVTLLRLTQRGELMWALIWVIIVTINVALGLSALFIWIQCSPIRKSFMPTVPGTCHPPETIITYLMFSTGYSGAMDIVLALLPWKLVWPLNMRRKEKVGVIIAMSMGVFAGITAAIKVVQTPRLKRGDVYDGAPVLIWTAAESSITMMAASVPILRTLLKQSLRSSPIPKHQPLQQDTPNSAGRKLFAAETFTMQSQSTVVIESKPRSTHEKSSSISSTLSSLSFWKSEDYGGHSRSGSRTRETIPEGVEPGMGGILRETEVAVVYHDQDAGTRRFL